MIYTTPCFQSFINIKIYDTIKYSMGGCRFARFRFKVSLNEIIIDKI